MFIAFGWLVPLMSYSEAEYEQVKLMILDHHGQGDQISSREINEVVQLDTVDSFPNTRRCVRDIMFEEKIPIIGGGNGYYVAETEQEIADAFKTLDSRILETAERKMALRRAANQWDNIETDDGLDIL